MGTKKKEKQKVRKKIRETIPFGRKNFIIFFIGILVIMLGYIFLAQGPADSFWSLTVAPILLVISYCIIIPLAIIYRRRASKQDTEQTN